MDIKLNYKLAFILIIQVIFIRFLTGNENHDDKNEDDDSANVNNEKYFEANGPASIKIGQKINETVASSTRYLIYGVNPGEGFNLRRDVYVRVANLIKHLRGIGEDFVLVLPPWRHLYHWRSNREQNGVAWKKFFAVDQLNKYIPVMEFDDFVRMNGNAGIDLIAYLQRHPDGFKNGWEEKIEEGKCTNDPVYWKDGDKYHGNFWGLGHVYGRDFKCISVQGTAKILTEFLQKSNARLG